MTKKILSLLFSMAFLLVACKPTSLTQPPVTETPTQVVKPTSQPTVAASASQPGCTVVSRSSDPSESGESPIPDVGERDWVKGPADAYVTIVEYGDFQ